MKTAIALLTGLFISVSVFSQNKVVYGKLVTFNTYPVQNVEVTAKKAKTTVVSDSLGQFSMVCFEKDIIRIKSETFQPVSKKVKPDTDSISLNLLFIDTKSNRELAVGYGYISEEDLTYAVNHLEHENNDFCSYNNILDLIKGRFPGVTVSGEHVYIVARGNTNLIGETQALYIVNGGPTSSIDWISPCDIKSIDILKSSEAAIYGSRGGNGVVLIVTRD